MKRKKGISYRDLQKPMYDKPQSRAVTPPRVAPRMGSRQKNAGIRGKKGR